jgi:hypothetical protein
VSAKETVVDILMREIRELGEAIVLVDQHPSQISVPALGNTYCTIGLNAKHSKDIHVLGEIMQIPREQREVLGLLPMGHAIIKLQSRFILPFQVRLPKVTLNKGSVTDSDLMQIYPPDSTDSGTKSAESPKAAATEPVPLGRKDRPGPGRKGLSQIEEQLLLDIRDHPLDGVVRRYARIGVSRRRGSHAKDKLIRRGVIQPVDVSTKNGKVVLLDFTSAMKEALRRNKVDLPGQRTGGLLHTYWKVMLAKTLKDSRWDVAEEKPIGAGRAVDLDARQGPCAVAVEVETGDRGLENITKLLECKYDWILTFSVDKDVELRTKRAMERAGLSVNNVLFASAVDYEEKVAFLTRRARHGEFDRKT